MSGVQDVIVIGGELTGYTAALEARRLGLDVLLVERPAAAGGGEGCDLHALREAMRRILQEAGPPGESDRSPGRRVRSVLRELLQDLEARARRSGVRVLRGDVVLSSATTVILSTGERREAPVVLLATGSRPRAYPRFPFGTTILPPERVLRDSAPPRNVLVVGAEALGCEVACLLAKSGAGVTLLDRRSRLLRFADRQLLEVLHHRMRELGISVVLEEEVDAVEGAGSREPHAVVHLGSGRVERVDRVVLVGARRGNSEGLGLEGVGVEREASGHLVTDEYFQTSCAGVYGVGDIAAGVGATVSVTHQARTALRHATGERWTLEDAHTPLTLQTLPELAAVGLTDEACRLLDLPCVTGVARYGETLAGRLVGHPDDLVKLVAASGDLRLLGVHWLGRGAIEMVHLGAEWLRAGVTVREIADLPFAPFGLVELYRNAALAAIRPPPASPPGFT